MLNKTDRKYHFNILLKILIFFIFCSNITAQTDSLEFRTISMQDDTTKINLLNKISKINKDLNTEKGIKFGFQALDLSIKLDYKKGIAEAYKNIGLNNWRRGTYETALENYQKSLNIFEEINDKQGIAIVNNYLGLLFFARVQFDKAIDFLTKSIEQNTKLNNVLELSRSQNNIALVYSAKKDYKQALYWHFESLTGAKRVNDSSIIAYNYCFIGNNYILLNKLDSAFFNLEMSLNIFEKINSLNDIAMVNNHLSVYYRKIGDFRKSLECAQKALGIGQKTGNRFMQMEALNFISESYFGLKDYKLAYDYRVKNMMLSDSLINEDNIRNIGQKDAQFEFDKILKKKEIEQKSELYKRNILFYAALIISFILLITSLTIFYFYKLISKTNLLLTQKNEEVTTQKEELFILNNKLESLNSTKDKFFSIIAHDLKNPLGDFRNITKLLSDKYNELSESDKVEFLELMKTSANNLYNLLENLLFWSRCQRGTILYQPSEFDLKYFADISISLHQLSAINKNITLENKIEEETRIIADQNILSIILSNLISNAIKFTPNFGKIEIGSFENPDNKICVYIKDSGVGINKENLDKIFRIDINLTTLGTNEEKGTGLGLILCKEFVEMHGGKIWVNSEENKGTTFYFTLSKV
jgi:signal transduction histidine kinase